MTSTALAFSTLLAAVASSRCCWTSERIRGYRSALDLPSWMRGRRHGPPERVHDHVPGRARASGRRFGILIAGELRWSRIASGGCSAPRRSRSTGSTYSASCCPASARRCRSRSVRTPRVRGRARARRGVLGARRRSGRKDALPRARATGRRVPAARFGSAALWAIARPELRRRPRADLRLIAALGVVLVSMNITFYEALESRTARHRRHRRVPRAARGGRARLASRDRSRLGRARGARRRAAREGWRHVRRSPGIALAATAGFFWALYILLSVHVGRTFPVQPGWRPRWR